jgi:hypothetical protein
VGRVSQRRVRRSPGPPRDGPPGGRWSLRLADAEPDDVGSDGPPPRGGLVRRQVAWRFSVKPHEYRELEAGDRWPDFETWDPALRQHRRSSDRQADCSGRVDQGIPPLDGDFIRRSARSLNSPRTTPGHDLLADVERQLQYQPVHRRGDIGPFPEPRIRRNLRGSRGGSR